MKKLIILALALFCLSAGVSAQVFTFECLCGQFAGDTCDICIVNPTVQSRSFSGLLIKKNGVPFKLIDAPYTIRRLKSESVQFFELGANPEQITIARFQTAFATMAGFVDSTNCFCGGNTAQIDTLFWFDNGTTITPVLLSDTIVVPIDTVSISNGGGLSITGTYPAFTISQNISTNATLAGIGTPGNPLKIAQQGATVGQTLKWNGTIWVPDNDIGVTGSGTAPFLAYWSGPNTIIASANAEIIGSDIRITDGSFTLFGSSGPGNLRVFSDGTKGDIQTFGSVALYLNRQGNDVYIPSIAGSGTRFVTVANTGLLGNVAINDNDASNELQNLSLSGQLLGISGGTGVTLPVVGISAGTGISVTTSSGVATVTNTGVTGSGTENFIPKFLTGGTSIGDSPMRVSGTYVGVGATPTVNFETIGDAIVRDKFIVGGVNSTTTNPSFNVIAPNSSGKSSCSFGYHNGSFNAGLYGMFFTPTDGKWYIGDVATGSEDALNSFVFSRQGSGATFVGLGTGSPSVKMDINGALKVATLSGTSATLGGWTSGNVATTITTGSGILLSSNVISATDASVTNELQTISTGTNTLTLSNSGGTVTVDTDPTNDLTTTTNFAGDVTGLYNNLQLGAGVVGPTELISTAVTAGTYGSATTVPSFTVDADGRITGVTNTTITAGASNWTISGADIYRNSNVAIGTTSFAGAKLNVENVGSSNITLRLGGGAMPSFGKLIELSGSGTGAYSAINSTLTSLGNVIYRLSNEGTSSGSNSLVQIATGGTSGGDPLLQFGIASGGVSVIGLDNSVVGEPLKIQPYTIVGAGTLGLTMTNSGKFGITDDTPEVTLDMAQNTDAISLPSGTTAQRPSVSLPLIRYNSTIGGPEYRDMNGSWGRIGCTSFPTFVFGNGAGTGSFPLGTSVNDMGGSIAVNTGSSPTANGIFVTVTFGQGFNKNPAVTICDGNNAASNAKFIVDSISTSGFVIKVNGTLSAATDYIIRYTVTN